MPRWVEAGWNEYRKRLPRQLSLELVEIAPGPGDNRQRSRAEGRALLARCPAGCVRVALDGRGADWSTRDLADRLEQWMMHGDPVALLVCGADGHDRALLADTRQHWSLGRLTFPHMLVRVIVAEQLYRAWSLLSGHPYHRQ